MDWLSTTFYYARSQSAPDEYDAGSDLRNRVSDTLSALVDEGFVEQDGLNVEPTRLGQLARSSTSGSRPRAGSRMSPNGVRTPPTRTPLSPLTRTTC